MLNRSSQHHGLRKRRAEVCQKIGDSGIPIVALFGPTDPARNGPYCERKAVLRSEQSLTSYSHVRVIDPALAAMEPAQIIAAAERFLEF